MECGKDYNVNSNTFRWRAIEKYHFLKIVENIIRDHEKTIFKNIAFSEIRSELPGGTRFSRPLESSTSKRVPFSRSGTDRFLGVSIFGGRARRTVNFKNYPFQNIVDTMACPQP